MSKYDKDFYKEKRIWSTVKDELLGCYLKPYFSKMLAGQNHVLYIDGFSGKGKFDDGSPGSPLIALKNFEESLDRFKKLGEPKKIIFFFIELRHHEDLKANISQQFKYKGKVLSGKFKERIIEVLNVFTQGKNNMRVFLYIDPYGITAIKDIPYSTLVAKYPESEVLINLNSFAFIREACRVMKTVFREGEDSVLGELNEYESSILKSTEELNEIAGGEYWRPILTSYKRGEIDCYTAEQQFSKGFKKRLRIHFKYVLDMPIRLKPNHNPKYRMVHATNHPDGCLLMADNMARRSDYLVMEIQNRGQLSFLDQSVENVVIYDGILKEKVKESLQNKTEYMNLGNFLAEFYDEYGVICGLSKLSSGNRSVLRIMEEEGYIEVIRNPERTPTERKSEFWQETNKKRIYLRKRAE